METKLYSIGHSNRTLADFIKLLRMNEVAVLVDVRRYPASRHNPHFNAVSLAASFAPYGRYVSLPELGGRRHAPTTVEPTQHTFWTYKGFAVYSDYALTKPFRDGLQKLRGLARTERVAYMCAEAKWWSCHRRIITDYLIAYGSPVSHIMSKAAPIPATLNEGARMTARGLIYSNRKAK